MDSQRKVVIHPSVHQPRLVLGGDRELVISLGLVSAILIFALVTWWSITFGLLLWLVGVALLARMGREDPLMRHIYVRRSH